MNQLKGKIAIVTGASRSEGIGTAICLALAEAGADIFFTHYSPYDASDEGCGAEKQWPDLLKENLEATGVRADHMELDLADEDAPSKLLDAVEERIGMATILVNNATFERRMDFRTLDASTLDRHYQVNNRGTLMLTMEFARRLEKRYEKEIGGRIVTITSGGPDPENIAYIATKGFLNAMTPPLATGLAPLGITINCVNPGPTDSGWIDDELQKQLLPLFPAGRIGLPSDAAKLVRFLVSPDAEWITGQVIYSNGNFLGR
ncbi:SDR family oxidoreductase [Halobacillus fulvus]|nr:SDR family oxidoreductase [Halobacillus fulvus]